MKKFEQFLALLIGVIMCFGATQTTASAKMNDRTAEQIKYSVGIIYNNERNSHGTTFAVGKKGEPVRYFITNNHCIIGKEGNLSKNLVIFSNDNKSSYKVSIIYNNKEFDFAILKTEDDVYDMVPITLSSVSCNVSDEAYAYGYPSSTIIKYNDIGEMILDRNASPENIAISHGEVNAKNLSATFDDGNTYKDLIRLSLNVNKGNSGGPLVNKYGDVIGVVQGSSADSESKMTYAVDIANVTLMLDSYEIPYEKRNSDFAVRIRYFVIAGILVIIFTVFLIVAGTKKRRFADLQRIRQTKILPALNVGNTKVYKRISLVIIHKDKDKFIKLREFSIEPENSYCIGYLNFGLSKDEAEEKGISQNHCKITVLSNESVTVTNLDRNCQCQLMISVEKERFQLTNNDSKTVTLDEEDFYVLVGNVREYYIKICGGK